MESTYTIVQENGIITYPGSPSQMTVRVPALFQNSVDIPGVTSGGNWVLVSSIDDFPSAVGGVITLEDNVTYVITTTVDLLGARLVAGQNTTLLGGSSENCRIKSTGLAGIAILSSSYSLPLRNVTIEANVALDLDASGTATAALDWFGVNFTDCGSIGSIQNYNNVILSDCAFLNSGDLTIDGTVNTFALSQCLLSIPEGQTGITIASTATIARRFRVIYSSFIVPSSSIGISVPNLNSFPLAESFILDTVSFGGSGTSLNGVSQVDAPALFTGCTGIPNSAAIVEYYMLNNATGTLLSLQNTFYKIEGITSAGPGGSQFVLSNNRATFIGARAGFFRAQSVITLTDGNNQDIALRFAVNGTTIPSSETNTNTGTGGRSQNVAIQGIVSLSSGSYVELWATNTTSAGATMTAVDMNTIISRFG